MNTKQKIIKYVEDFPDDILEKANGGDLKAIMRGLAKRCYRDGKLEGMRHVAFFVNSEVEECFRQEEPIDVTKIKQYVEPEILKELNS